MLSARGLSRAVSKYLSSTAVLGSGLVRPAQPVILVTPPEPYCNERAEPQTVESMSRFLVKKHTKATSSTFRCCKFSCC